MKKKILVITILFLFSTFLFLNLQQIPAEQLISDNAAAFYQKYGLEKTESLNLVTAILYDFRAFDSLAESTVIFAAVSGIVLVLSRKTISVSSHGLSFIVKRTFAVLTPFVFLFSIYIITHGHISPGGGFQGGVILASISIIFIIIYGSAFDYKMISPKTKTLLETGGALTFIFIGFLGILIEGIFLDNINILNSEVGSLFSAGSIPIVNIGIGLKVGAGLAIIFYSMIQKTLERSWIGNDK